MKRWKKLAMNRQDIQQIIRNQKEMLPGLERYEPEYSQMGCRMGDVTNYTMLALLHHLEVEGTPGEDGIRFARRGAVVAIDFFFGSWRDRYEHRGRTIEQWDAATCRRRMEWFDTYRMGLFCACALGDSKAMASLLKWPDCDLPRDNGTWNHPAEENEFHILLALSARREKAKEQERLHAKIEKGRPQRPRLWLAGLDAILSKDGPAFTQAMEALLDYNLHREFQPDHPYLAVMIEGTILWAISQATKLQGVSVSEAVTDRLVTIDTLRHG